MHLALACARCGARLAPTMSGLRCPRLTACGKGGAVESFAGRFTRWNSHGSGNAEA